MQVKIQTTSKNSQRYYRTKLLRRDLLSNIQQQGQIGMFVPPNFVDIYLQGMRDSGTELARQIQLTDWSTAGNLSKRSSVVQIPRDIRTRLRRYLYSAKCSWIINTLIITTYCMNKSGFYCELFFCPFSSLLSLSSLLPLLFSTPAGVEPLTFHTTLALPVSLLHHYTMRLS